MVPIFRQSSNSIQSPHAGTHVEDFPSAAELSSLHSWPYQVGITNVKHPIFAHHLHIVSTMPKENVPYHHSPQLLIREYLKLLREQLRRSCCLTNPR